MEIRKTDSKGRLVTGHKDTYFQVTRVKGAIFLTLVEKTGWLEDLGGAEVVFLEDNTQKSMPDRDVFPTRDLPFKSDK